MSAESGGLHSMPKGVENYYPFQVSNMIAMGMVTGTPMLLYFKEFGASETLLGVVAAIPLLLFTLQLPAAKYIERVGYRRFVCSGYVFRPIFIFGMIVVAFLPSNVGNLPRIIAMLCMIFCLGATRGISTSGMLPWMCALVPESLRGRFVSGDQMSVATAGIFCSLLNALIFSHLTAHIGFEILFVTSFVLSICSQYFLRRIPDAPVPHAVRNSNPVPWMKIISYPPFFRAILFIAFVYLAIGASTVFWVPFFRETLHMTKSKVLIFGAIEGAFSLVMFYFFSKKIDRLGSKPVLCAAFVLYACCYMGWAAMAAGVYPSLFPFMVLQQALSGMAGALFSLASTRLLMVLIPAMGRSHFFAFYMMAVSIVAAVVPIGWGRILDFLRGWHVSFLGWEWNKYSFLYAVLFMVAIGAQFVLRIVEEPRAGKMKDFFREVFGTRAQFFLRPRRPGF